MKRLYIHAGFHKTATSYLQQFLRTNQRVLSRHVLYYLDKAYRRTPYANHVLPASIRTASHPEIVVSEPREVVWRRFLETARRSRRDKVLVSSEVFLEGIDLTFLRRALESLDVTFIFYVRRQDEYFESVYVERIKQGSSESVTEFYNKWKHGGFDFFSYIQAFEHALPNAKIAVREFNRKLFPAGDIAQDLLNVLGVQLTESECGDLEDVGLPNRRLSVEQVELMRRFNELPVDCAEKRAFRRYLLELTAREASLSDLTPLRVDSQLKEEILKIAAESNERLIQRYLGDGDFFSRNSLRGQPDAPGCRCGVT